MTMTPPRRRSSPRAFTLTELLVAMGIIALLATLTVVSISALARDSRLASSKNTVVAALGTARAYAMKNNTLTLVVFRPKWDPDRPEQRQVTEVVTAAWTGRSFAFGPGDLADQFVAVPGLAPRELSAGIKVAAPHYEIDEDLNWLTQTDLRSDCGQRPALAYSQLIGVMFSPDGALLTRNPNASGADHKTFLDLNGGDDDGDGDPQEINFGDPCPGNSLAFWWLDEPEDETNINLAQFLAIYDDDQARELYDASGWSSVGAYLADLAGPGGYITNAADRIHFNRYTGVVMK